MCGWEGAGVPVGREGGGWVGGASVVVVVGEGGGGGEVGVWQGRSRNR